MSTAIKSSAIPAAGYVYQTMQGVSLLCDWLDAPTRYVRVRFECDEDAVAPQGLDDLVAERPDGRVDLWQVKFTPAAEKHLLDWDWMLERPGKVGGKSRSNLRKWFDAFNRIPAERIGEVGLLTNRAPDTVVEACLNGGFIDYTKAPEAIRLMVEAELGGAENAKRLFTTLQVKHSDKGFAGIAVHVTDRLRRHGSAEGIETLKNRAVYWSIQKDQPTPGGWISLEEVRVTLRAVAPEPLPENFVVPAGYRVPDTTFHNTFVATIEAVPGQPIVLTGPPGRGKSTYLSKMCDVLQRRQIPFVRHHYYLSTTDRSLDRLTSFAVEESLLAQVRIFHGDVAIGDRGLAPALSACASHYKALGKPFVVILDGLDHVWRSYGHDKRPLDEVFNQVLPCVDNLVLVVGTQPVDEAELPNRLLVEAPRSSWRDLPAMSSDAVRSYLRKEVKFGRLRLEVQKRQSEEELQSAAAELRDRTNGHPLHVIYATEELVRSGKALSKWNLEQLAGDLSQDVKSYYGSLWQLLGASQKDVLRLVCAFEFFWPKRAFGEVAALSGSPEPEVTAVEHLLHSSAAGLRVFHESLTVFVLQTDDFDRRVTELTPHVETWLSSSAPSALRVNWLWAVQAKQDRPENLIAGLQRDWVLERLQEGYPIELFEGLLADAEERALCRAQYADAYRLRHLKHRLLNSLSYQLLGADAARLKTCTWKLAPDDSVIDEAMASRHEASTVDVAALGIALAARGDPLSAGVCGDEAYRRHLGESRFTGRSRSSEARDEVLFLVKSLSTLQAIGRTRQAAARIVGVNSPQIAGRFLGALVEAKNLRSLVDIALDLPDGAARVMACDAAVRAAALVEADLTAWSEFPRLSSTNLAGCLAAMSGLDAPIWSGRLDTDWLAGGYDERREALAKLAHDWLFGAAHLQLVAGEQFCLLAAPLFKDRENVSEYLNVLGEVAREFARKWRQGKPVYFAELFVAFEDIEFSGYGRGYELGQGATDFRRALHAIAVDAYLLGAKLGSSPLIDAEELQRAMTCAWFDGDEFRKQYVSGGVKALSDEAAAYFVNQQLASLDGSVGEETGVRMVACLDLCEMALRHELQDLARGLCRKTWDLVLGYGQRKDSVLPDVMDALEYLADIESEETKRLLVEVAPQVHNILEYTDGKGTRHVLGHADRLLAKLHRGALVEKYKEHTEVGDWSAAEDSLKAFVAGGAPSSPLTDAVLRTGVHAEVHDVLRSAASGGDWEATRRLALADAHIGTDAGQLREPDRGGSSVEWKPFTGDVKTYGVADLARLQADLREHFGIRGDVLREWYAYWEKEGKGSELIAALEPQLLSDACRDNDLYELLDDAFETKRKLNGAAAAFPLIVQAQLMKGGWLGPMHLEKIEKTESRLRLVAKTYRRRCDEFVAKSAFSWLSRPKHSRVIPGEVMVFFLGFQGRTAEAVQFAEAMVRCVQGDTRTLPLTAPEWARHLAAAPGGCPMNVELELLVSRLRWPIASTRWWAMQELSELLLSPELGVAVSTRLLEELRHCRLEAEAVEVLCVFWMAATRGYAPPSELPEAVLRPSMLASSLLDGMGLTLYQGPNPPLQVAPADFEVPSQFFDVQGFQVPRIYLTRLRQLESYSGLAFVHQCGFEWAANQDAYPDAPLQGDLSYFTRPMGDGMTGAFASRAMLRMLSAYQRTLAVAQQHWHAPEDLMRQFALDALPVDPTLAFLRPARPSWLPPLGQHIGADGASVESFIGQTTQALEAMHRGSVLLALATPTYVNREEIVELSVVRWRQWTAAGVDAEQLETRFRTRIESGEFGRCRADGVGVRTALPVLTLDAVVDEESQAAPMAAVRGIDRLGYLQRDLYPDRLYYPVVTGSHASLSVEPLGDQLSVCFDRGQLATVSYWNVGWGPVHPASTGGLYGTALVGVCDQLEDDAEARPLRYFYLWRLRRFRKSSGYGELAEEVLTGLVFM